MTIKKEIPEIIRQVGFDFSWDERKGLGIGFSY